MSELHNGKPLLETLRDFGVQAAGVLVGLVVFGAVCVAPVALPLLKDNSQSWTCDDEEIADFCEDPYTIAGFAAAICGRDEIEFEGTVIQDIVIGGEGYEDTPDDMRMEMRCDGVNLAWEAPVADFQDIEDISDIPPANEQTELYMRLVRSFSLGDINISTARDLLQE